MKLTGGKKLRFYLAYWRRKESPTNPGKYHVGLLLAPKSPNNDLNTVMLYHAINVIDGDTRTEKWIFEPKKSAPRTIKLAGVMLLGKVPSNFSMETITPILEKVYVPTPEEAREKNWRCRHWLLDALEVNMLDNLLNYHLTFSFWFTIALGGRRRYSATSWLCPRDVGERTRLCRGQDKRNRWISGSQ